VSRPMLKPVLMRTRSDRCCSTFRGYNSANREGDYGEVHHELDARSSCLQTPQW
jgi:hypothetical protein